MYLLISSLLLVPRTGCGSAPPERNELTRTPPCQFECFPPFSGLSTIQIDMRIPVACH